MSTKYRSEKKEKPATVKIIIIVSMLVVTVFMIGIIVTSTAFNLFYKAGVQADEYVGDFFPDTESLKDGTYKGDFKVFDFNFNQIKLIKKNWKLI